jgi:hypothetical protein
MWPLDEDRLDDLERIRAAYAPLADAGDERAERIVAAVEGMIVEMQDWLDRAASRISKNE